MAEKKLTNKELIRFRKRMKVRELAIAEFHERTHTGTATNRRLKVTEGDTPEVVWPTPASTPEELEEQLHAFLDSGVYGVVRDEPELPPRRSDDYYDDVLKVVRGVPKPRKF